MASLHEDREKNEGERRSRTKFCDASHQTFAVYIDQENAPWPSVDMIVQTTGNNSNNGKLFPCICYEYHLFS